MAMDMGVTLRWERERNFRPTSPAKNSTEATFPAGTIYPPKIGPFPRLTPSRLRFGAGAI